MYFKFVEFDLGNEIAIKVSDKYVIRFSLPADFSLAQREVLNHFLGLVASAVNHLPQTEKDELFRRYFLKDKIPSQSGDHTTGMYVRILRMDVETQEICQCPQRVGQVCLSHKTQKH